MKRLCLWALALCLALWGSGALAQESQGILVGDAPYSNSYDCAVTGDGCTVIGMGLRYLPNYTEGQNPINGRLVCIGEGGKLRWEHSVPGENGIYSKVCVLTDSTVLALYARDPGAEAQMLLRRFSANGELLGETMLPENAMTFVPTGAGMLVSLRTSGPEEETPRYACVLYGPLLEPLWQVEDLRCAFRYDCAVPDGDGLTLLYRDNSLREQRDGVRLLRLDAQGKVLWSQQLAQKQMGYMSLKMDADGNRIVYLGGWDLSQTREATLYSFDENGGEQWRKTVALPELEGELSGFQLTEDGFLLLGLAKTDTCVRLYRFDWEGRFLGSTDQALHEELAYSNPEFAALGGKLYACVTERQDTEDQSYVYLMPLTLPE